VKNIVAKEFGIPVDIHEKESEHVDLNNAKTEQDHHGLQTILERYLYYTNYLVFLIIFGCFLLLYIIGIAKTPFKQVLSSSNPKNMSNVINSKYGLSQSTLFTR
jgi:hypothetical protein